MNSFINYLSSETTILYRWQTLVGSIIGVMGALLVGFLGFIANHLYQKWKDLRENLRITEITLALALNDIYDAEGELKGFLERLFRITINPLKNNEAPNEYFLSETNFPTILIRFDTSLLTARYKSYY